MKLYRHEPHPVFLIFKKIAKLILPKNFFIKFRKIAIEILWTIVYSSKNKRYKNYKLYTSSLKNLSGLEIGGSSWVWMTVLPIYQSIKKLDNVSVPSIDEENSYEMSPSSRYTTGQIMNATLGWEKANEGNNKFNWFLLKKGNIFFQDAVNLDKIESEKYDFVISSNVFEHIANPLKALNEFKRVIKKDGYIVIIVPYYKNTFDYKRPVTTIEHIREDFKNSVGEDDLTALNEVVELTDESSEVHNNHPNKNFDKNSFEAYCKDNFKNRGMHHHVFDVDLLSSIANEVDLKVLDVNYFDNSCVLFTQKK